MERMIFIMSENNALVWTDDLIGLLVHSYKETRFRFIFDKEFKVYVGNSTPLNFIDGSAR